MNASDAQLGFRSLLTQLQINVWESKVKETTSLEIIRIKTDNNAQGTWQKFNSTKYNEKRCIVYGIFEVALKTAKFLLTIISFDNPIYLVTSQIESMFIFNFRM